MKFGLILLAAQFFLSSGYLQEIDKHRREIDRRFADPLTSPLAVFAIRRLEGHELVVGSSSGSGLVLDDPSVKPQHARILRNGRDSAEFQIEALDGEVSTFPNAERISRSAWKVDQRLRVGRFLLVLQIHPAGPVVRAIDLESRAVQDFRGLHYFPADPALRVKGRIEPQEPMRQIRMIDTQGWRRPAWVYGRIHFEIDSQPQQLSLILFDFQPGPDSRFMLIFRDVTSGRESYPACRYLYLPYQKEGFIEVDFNRAFNPYCAYADGFACPLPLPGNKLSAPIRAGEKAYH